MIASLPFSGAPATSGIVSAGTANSLTITDAAFTTDQYRDRYYVRIRSGVDNGLWTTIVSNTATTLFTADDVTTVVAGDAIEIVNHQTLDSVFPAALANILFVPSTATSVAGRKTTIHLIGPPPTIGINRAPGSGGTFFYYSGKWRNTTATSVDAGTTILIPQQYYIIRNGGGASQTLQVLTAGAVNPSTIATYTERGGSAQGQNDNPLATGRPMDLSLNDLGLGGSSAFVDSLSTSLLDRRDTVWLFDNTRTGINRSPGSGGIYFRYAGTWRRTTAPGVDVSTNLILQAGAGFVVRKSTNSVQQTEVWAETITP